MQHLSRRENICDEDAIAFLKINSNTVPPHVFLVKRKVEC